MTIPAAILDDAALPEKSATSAGDALSQRLRSALAAAKQAAAASPAPATGPCTHTDAVPGYRLPAWMRAHIQARDQHCFFPTCRQDASRCDLDHLRPYGDNGPSCPCNIHPGCRRHHRCKTHATWRLTSTDADHLRWATPARLTYTNDLETHVA